MKWTRLLRDVQNSSYKEGRIDTPYHANKILENFKHINQTRWSKLAVIFNYFIICFLNLLVFS